MGFKKKKKKKKPSCTVATLPSPTLPFFSFFFFFFFLLTFLLLHVQALPRWVCHTPFLLCLFLGLMGCLDQIVQSLIYIPSSDPSRYVPLHNVHRPCPLPMVPIASDSNNPSIYCDSHMLVHGFLAF